MYLLSTSVRLWHHARALGVKHDGKKKYSIGLKLKKKKTSELFFIKNKFLHLHRVFWYVMEGLSAERGVKKQGMRMSGRLLQERAKTSITVSIQTALVWRRHGDGLAETAFGFICCSIIISNSCRSLQSRAQRGET